MIKKLFFATLFFLIFSGFAVPAAGHAQDQVNVYFFYSNGCPHCDKQKDFIDNKLSQEYGQRVIFNQYEVSQESSLFNNFNAATGWQIKGVPATFVGANFFTGYNTDGTTGQELKDMINTCLSQGCEDIGAEIIAQSTGSQPPSTDDENPVDTDPNEDDANGADTEAKIEETKIDSDNMVFDLPLVGEVDLAKYSLFGLTVTLAAVDGFNPCAMWVLILLITMLIGMKDRRRMWILGLTFIAASAAVYFLFLAAWFNVFRLIGVVRWFQIIVGLVALGVGVFYLRRFWKSRPGECEVTNVEQRRKITDRLKEIVQKRSLWLALGGIVVMAGIVNLIELACSAGLPAIFTQVLALNELPTWEYYGYLLLYILVFMLDDMVIFAVAMVTLKAVGMTGKYSRYATLIGGIVILVLGVLLILKPEWVMFG